MSTCQLPMVVRLVERRKHFAAIQLLRIRICLGVACSNALMTTLAALALIRDVAFGRATAP